MVPALFFYQLTLIYPVWLCLMLQWAWPSDPAVCPTTPEPPLHGARLRVRPNPLQGSPPSHTATPVRTAPTLAHSPRMPAPAHRAYAGAPTPGGYLDALLPQPRLCLLRLGGLGQSRANGHPNGGPWRQFHCTACEGYFLETHGTLHGKRVPVDLIVHVLACLAEGLGIRATAQVFEVAPTPSCTG